MEDAPQIPEWWTIRAWFHHFPTEVPTRPAAAGPLHAGPQDEVAVLPQWVINSRAFDSYWTNQRQNMIAQAREEQHKNKYRGWNLLRIARHICKNKHWLKMSAEGQQAWKNEFANRYPVIALAHGAAGDEEDGGHEEESPSVADKVPKEELQAVGKAFVEKMNQWSSAIPTKCNRGPAAQLKNLATSIVTDMECTPTTRLKKALGNSFVRSPPSSVKEAQSSGQNPLPILKGSVGHRGPWMTDEQIRQELIKHCKDRVVVFYCKFTINYYQRIAQVSVKWGPSGAQAV